MAGVKGSKFFAYTDKMRSRAKELFTKRVPNPDSKRPFGLWSDLSKEMNREFPELKELPDLTLRNWIRNVCLYDKVSIQERGRRNSKGIKAIQESNRKRNEEFKRNYPDRLKQEHNGKFVVVDETTIKTSLTPIEHKCLVHNKVYRTRPADLLKGKELMCCGTERRMLSNDELERRAELCGIRWTSEYVHGDSPRDCECLVCGHPFNIIPNSLQNKIGRGGVDTEGSSCPRCLSLLQSRDSIRVFSEDRDYADSYAEIYLYWDATYEWFKIGISKDSSRRAYGENSRKTQSPFYEDQIWVGKSTRSKCWAVEQVCLALSITSKPTQEEEDAFTYRKGFTEIRRASDWDYDTEKVQEWMSNLLEICESSNWIDFMLKYHPRLDAFSRKELKEAKQKELNRTD
jgi:hypothetical protein